MKCAKTIPQNVLQIGTIPFWQRCRIFSRQKFKLFRSAAVSKSKKTFGFFKGHFALEMFRWTTKMQFWQPSWLYCKTIQTFFDQSPKMRKTKNKIFEKPNSSNCQSRHTEWHFKEPVRVFPMKVRTVFYQIQIKEQAQIFRKKKPENVSLDIWNAILTWMSEVFKLKTNRFRSRSEKYGNWYRLSIRKISYPKKILWTHKAVLTILQKNFR